MDTPETKPPAKPITISDSGDEPHKVAVRFRSLPSLTAKTREAGSTRSVSSLQKLRLVLARASPWLRHKLTSVLQYKPAAGSTRKNLELHLAVPALPSRATIIGLPKKLRRLPRATLLKLIIAAVVLVIIGHYLLASHKPKAPLVTTTNSTHKLARGTPRYDTVLPAGKTINQLGGWTRVSPPDRNPVYAYVDKVGATSLTVSEQPLPANLQRNSDQQISELAQNFNATDKITANGLTAYIGTSAKGPQSVILSKNNLLILIKSETALTNAQWVSYVSSLQ